MSYSLFLALCVFIVFFIGLILGFKAADFCKDKLTKEHSKQIDDLLTDQEAELDALENKIRKLKEANPQ